MTVTQDQAATTETAAPPPEPDTWALEQRIRRQVAAELQGYGTGPVMRRADAVHIALHGTSTPGGGG